MEKKKTDFEILRAFVKGKDYDNQIDNLFDEVRQRKLLGDSIVYLSSNFDDVTEMLGLDDDDTWFLNVVNGSGYEFLDYYSARDDFKDNGIFFHHFDEDNKNLLKTVSQFLLPTREFDLGSSEFEGDLAREMMNSFPKETDNIIDEWIIRVNDAGNESARSVINDEIEYYLKKIDFGTDRHFSMLYTTVANLIYWYHRFAHYTLTVKELVNKILESEKSRSLGGWGDDPYAFAYNNQIDLVGFNRDVNWQLEKMVDYIEDQPSFKDFLDMANRIQSKFKMNVWYILPKQKNIVFRVIGFDKVSRKIAVEIRKNGDPHSTQNFLLSEEDFYNLLYQYSLFGKL